MTSSPRDIPARNIRHVSADSARGSCSRRRVRVAYNAWHAFLEAILIHLKQERDRLNQAIAALEGISNHSSRLEPVARCLPEPEPRLPPRKERAGPKSKSAGTKPPRSPTLGQRTNKPSRRSGGQRSRRSEGKIGSSESQEEVVALFNDTKRVQHAHANLARNPGGQKRRILSLMRTVAIPDYRSTPGNKGAYALRRVEDSTAHFLMVTFWDSEEPMRAFAGNDISVAKYYDFDKDFLLEMKAALNILRDVRPVASFQNSGF
jgi:hypothetical protein